MYKVTIIVPIYNTEPFLRQCIESILSQSLTDFLCILVNDGSTDNSPSICDEYAKKDSRIMVIHKQNAGVSSARNAGLKIALNTEHRTQNTEQFVGFVDSDDWCEPGMFEFLYNNAIKHKADISICGWRDIKNNEVISNQKPYSDEIMTGLDARFKLLSGRYFHGFTCDKLINTRLFFDHTDELRFDEAIQFSEDRLFIYALFMRARRVFYSPQPYYNYRIHDTSVTSTASRLIITDALMTRFSAFDKILQMESDSRLIKKNKHYYSDWIIQIYFKLLKTNPFNSNDPSVLFIEKHLRRFAVFILMYGNKKRKKKLLHCFLLSIKQKITMKSHQNIFWSNL